MRQRARSYLAILAGGVLMAVVVLAVGVALGEREEPDVAPTAITADIVYLADPSSPGLDPERARADGAHVVTSARRLEADSSAADTVIGIVFDARQRVSLSPGWIASQAERGRVIVAIDLPMAELDALTGLHDLGPANGFKQDWRGGSFYSLRYRSPAGAASRYSGRASDRVISPERLFEAVRATVRPPHAP